MGVMLYMFIHVFCSVLLSYRDVLCCVYVAVNIQLKPGKKKCSDGRRELRGSFRLGVRVRAKAGLDPAVGVN